MILPARRGRTLRVSTIFPYLSTQPFSKNIDHVSRESVRARHTGHSKKSVRGAYWSVRNGLRHRCIRSRLLAPLFSYRFIVLYHTMLYFIILYCMLDLRKLVNLYFIRQRRKFHSECQSRLKVYIWAKRVQF